MKVSREVAAEHRAKVVEAASRLFREQGVGGVSVADVSSAAGLTHGGFYRQFDSKQALFAEAVELSLCDEGAELARASTRPDGLERYASRYLSAAHVEGKGRCPIATLGAEVAREGRDIQAAFARGLRAYLAAGRSMAVGSAEWRRSTAALSTLIGALVMARAVGKADPELSQAVVGAALEAWTSRG